MSPDFQQTISQKRAWFILSKQELALMAITMFWGGTFLAVQTAMQYSDPLFFVGFRFGTAGLCALVIFAKQMRGITRYELFAGASIGLLLCLGYSLQTAGLKMIESSKSAFITALYVPMVPILQWIFLRQTAPFMRWVGIVLAFMGLLLVSAPQNLAGTSVVKLLSFGIGEWLTLVSALSIALEIILISRFAGKVNTARVTALQLLFGSVFSFMAMPVMGESLPALHWVPLFLAVGLGVASVVIQFTMNWAQRTVSATRATIIYAGEPLWGGVVGRIAGERLPGIALIGAGLIIAGIVISELRPTKLYKKMLSKEKTGS